MAARTTTPAPTSACPRVWKSTPPRREWSLSSRYNSSYGNYCIINHGNGYATLYAHQKQLPLVKVGDTVSKGQVIGYVGNTGNSYGAHLHFELRVNGVRDDVLKLYPGLNYIDRS